MLRGLSMGSTQIGTATSKVSPMEMPLKPGGVTPITWKELPSRVRRFPITGRIAGEVSLPEGVTDVGSRRAATGPVIFRTEQSPQNGFDT